MDTYIALLRAINVGGRSTLRMKELVHELQHSGLHDVRTYIQSGNIVFRAKRERTSALAKRIESVIDARFGFRPRALTLTTGQFASVINHNPYPDAELEPKSLHVLFLATNPPKPDLDALSALATSEEQFHLNSNVFYMYCPNGIGRSKLAAGAERLLGVPATARNWRTVLKLHELAKNN